MVPLQHVTGQNSQKSKAGYRVSACNIERIYWLFLNDSGQFYPYHMDLSFVKVKKQTKPSRTLRRADRKCGECGHAEAEIRLGF